MLSDENDNFLRDYEILYDATLADFHAFILESLEYENCITSFFTADDRWEKLQEFTLEDMGDLGDGAPMMMDKVLVGQVVSQLHDRLIYQFDMFGDRAYYLELTGARKAQEDAEYPREIFAQADVPDQYDLKVNTSGGSVYDDIMDDFNDFEGDDSYDDEY